jgi:glucoamylase
MRKERDVASNGEAPGGPGLAPHWTSSHKDAVGTAPGPASHLWFTLSHGIVDEVYYPRVDIANTRDAQFLVAADGFFSEEKRATKHAFAQLDPWAPAYRLTNTCLHGRYVIEKDVLSDPVRHVLLQQVRFQPLVGQLTDYRLYLLLAPHLANHGYGNTAWVADYNGVPMLFAQRRSAFLAVASSSPFVARSVGFVGVSDGWQDVSQHYQMRWQYQRAADGNVALTGQIIPPADGRFTLALAFGRSAAEAAQQAWASLLTGFPRCRDTYIQGWRAATEHLRDLTDHTGDGGRLFRTSALVLLTHADKSMPGASVASLSIPWGEIQGDGDLGGYHLVWTRDLVEAAGAKLAIDDTDSAWAALLYLATIQRADGSWPQNNWLDGVPYWAGVQLDETAFPILLAWRLREEARRRQFDLWPLVRAAAGYLARTGPVTGEERWEEDGGYSPSTLATGIAALVCAAGFARDAHEPGIAGYLEAVADWWASRVDDWTYTTQGDLLPGHPAYYERIGVPVLQDGDQGRPTDGEVPIRNLTPGQQATFPARDVVDGGFLELVRFGVRPAADPHVRSSLPVIDALLKIDFPGGPAWKRYNHDGYGEHADGYPFDGSGIGRRWPLLTGERGHYELAAGNAAEARRLARAMEHFAGDAGLLPEQIWDGPPIAKWELEPGRPSGSAMPLVWAHAEYVKLLRSLADGRVFDCLDVVAQRYATGAPAARNVWRFNHKLRAMPARQPLRIEVAAAARVHWSADGWRTIHDTETTDGGLGLWYVDLPATATATPTTVAFTFFWSEAGRWEGRDYGVEVQAGG